MYIFDKFNWHFKVELTIIYTTGIKKPAKPTDTIRIMKIRIGVFSVLFGIIVLLVPSGELHGEERVHIVQSGETFFSIARTQGIRAEELMRHNGVTDPTRLQVGQRLRIPVAAPVGGDAPLAAPAVYRVVRGDTFFSIARRFSVTVDALRRANGLSDDYILREGDLLRLPPEARIPAESGILASAPAAGSLPAAAGAGMVQGTLPRSETWGSEIVDPSVRWPIVAREVQYMTGKLSGVVITGTRSEPVRSLTRGTVLSAGPYRGFGMVVIVQVEGGYLYVYGGCETLSVREGDLVGPGTELGRLGIDAATNQPKLFFMVYRGNEPVNPARAPRG